MIYYILKSIVRFGLLLLFRNIHISGFENIPKDKPTLLVSNHPTAFLEPILLACFIDRPLYFFASGRFFSNWLIRNFFHSIHMLPIYNIEDGVGNLRDSVSKLKDYQDKLAENYPMLIYAESTTKQLRYLRPLKKGFVRMGFRAMENFDLEEVYLVPVGCNYRQANKKRQRVNIEIGAPLNLGEYWSKYKQNAANTTNEVLDIFTDILKKHIVSPKNRKADMLYEKLLSLIDNELYQPAFPIYSNSQNYLKLCRRFIDRIDKMDDETIELYRSKLRTYLDLLAKWQQTDQAVSNNFVFNTAQKIGYLFGFIPAYLGRLLFYPLVIIEKKTKEKVRRREFVLSMYFGGALAYLSIFALISICLILFLNSISIIPILLVCVFGLFSIYYFDQKPYWDALRKASTIPEDVKKEMKAQRTDILSYFYARKLKNDPVK